MFAIDDKTSIFCALEIRGMASIATAFTFLSANFCSNTWFWAGHK